MQIVLNEVSPFRLTFKLNLFCVYNILCEIINPDCHAMKIFDSRWKKE